MPWFSRIGIIEDVDVAGIGRAVREAGLQGKTCVMGTSLPSVAGEFGSGWLMIDKSNAKQYPF